MARAELEARLELMRWATRIVSLRDQGKQDTDEYREAVRRRDEARERYKSLTGSGEAHERNRARGGAP
ncbi:MAG: hypothetical protein K6T78_08085 [Alicyclobacillus sp.]|nr:hypothetical protein [Alicyclobacillus sp.]